MATILGSKLQARALPVQHGLFVAHQAGAHDGRWQGNCELCQIRAGVLADDIEFYRVNWQRYSLNDLPDVLDFLKWARGHTAPGQCWCGDLHANLA